MTFVNWLSIGLVVTMFLVGIGLRVYYARKVRDLDGFMGIVSYGSEEEDEN